MNFSYRAICMAAFSLLATMLPTAVPATTAQPEVNAPNKGRLIVAYGQLPLSFERNQGQTDERVNFISRGSGYVLFLTPTEAVLTLQRSASEKTVSQRGNSLHDSSSLIRSDVVKMKLLGTNPKPEVSATDRLPGRVNYFIGNDPKKWRRDIPIYAGVQYKNVYAGVDLAYHGNQRQLEYDFIVAPAADPHVISLAFEGLRQLQIAENGDLILRTADGEIRFRKPLVYQLIDGIKHEVAGNYIKKGRHEIGFQVAAYDCQRALVIDPVLAYSTYLGGSDQEAGTAIAVDSAGSAYVAGVTLSSTDFPTTSGSFQETVPAATQDAFVTKLDPAGANLVYSTYLGGSGADVANGIAVDGAGAAYITGFTTGTNFPTTVGAAQTAYGGGFAGAEDAFVSKLDPSGSNLAYSTYLGGSSDDTGAAIAVDGAGNAYVTGGTGSTEFPTTSETLQSGLSGSSDAFVTKVEATGSNFLYSTYLGGGSYDIGAGIAVDFAGNAYVTGQAQSTNFPTTPGAFQPTYRGGSQDGFIAKLNSSGNSLVFSSYLGGGALDEGFAVALDPGSYVYVTGQTVSTNFPTTVGALQTGPSGGQDAFVTKLDPSGSNAVYSTYLGGSGVDQGFAIAVDTNSNAYVTGVTGSTSNFPSANPSQVFFGGGSHDAFVTKLNQSGSAAVFSRYLGGSGNDVGRGVALDADGGEGNIYLTGDTASSTNFPVTPGAFQTAFGGGAKDAYIVKFSPSPPPPPCLGVSKLVACMPANSDCSSAVGYASLVTAARGDSQDPGSCYKITVTNCGSMTIDNLVVSDDVLGDLSGNFPSSLPIGGSAAAFFLASHATNTANTVTAQGESGTNVVQASASASVTVVQATISCVKRVSSPADQDGNPNDSHVSLPNNGSTNSLTYRIQVAAGNVALSNCMIDDPTLSASGCSMPAPFSLAANATNIFTLCTVFRNCTSGSFASFTNTVTVTAEVDESSGVCGHSFDGESTSAISVSSASAAVVQCVPFNQPPVVLCSNVVVSAGSNCTANASINAGSYDPEGGAVTLVQTPPGPYSLGQTFVVLTVTDTNGASSSCTNSVTVVDTTAPSISCPPNVYVGSLFSGGRVVNYPAPTASDNCSFNVFCSPASGSLFPVGTTSVTCSAFDNRTNVSFCTFTVNVADLGVDVFITNLTLQAIAAPALGFPVTNSVLNVTQGTSRPAQVQFYLSTDTVIDKNDAFLGQRKVPKLPPGGSSSVVTPVVLSANTAPGQYFILSVAKPDDKSSSSAAVTQSSAVALAASVPTSPASGASILVFNPDLKVPGLTHTNSVKRGTSINITDVTQNLPNVAGVTNVGPAGISTSYIYLSTTTNAASGATLLKQRAVPALDPGVTFSNTFLVSIPAGTAAGNYFIVDKANGNSAVVEPNKTNNITFKAISVTP